jgi:hypothetical protein
MEIWFRFEDIVSLGGLGFLDSVFSFFLWVMKGYLVCLVFSGSVLSLTH